MKKLMYLFFSAILLLSFSLEANAEIMADPIGIAASLEADDEASFELTLTNPTDEAVAFAVDFDKPPEEERRQGPRRDDVDLEDRMFAVFQDARAWNFLDEWMMDNIEGLERLDPDEQGTGYHSYRNANAWDEVDFDDYDAIVIAGHRQSNNFIGQYRENYERFCDYIAHGGAAYFEMGDANQEIHSPGDIVNNGPGSESNGRMVTDPEPEHENYSLFAEICNESQGGNLWTFGHVIQGSQWTHSHYNLNQFEDNDEIDWFQVLAVKERQGTPGAIAYGYGSGVVLTQGGPTGFNWQHHRQAGRWGSIGGEILYYLIEMVGPGWLLADPEEGEIPANDETVVELTLNSTEVEPGIYEMRLIFEIMPNPIEMSIVMSVESETANLSGIVTDAAEENVIENVSIEIDRYIIDRFTDEEGAYLFEALPVGDYTFTFTAEDFLPTTREVSIEEAGEVELNAAMLHSECTPDPDEIIREIAPDGSIDLTIEVANGGNGPLAYTVERRLLGDANADPWTLRLDHHPGVDLEDNYIQGVIFDGDNFYAGGRGDDNPVIYVLDREGRLERQFEQPGDDDRGYKDLAWDGELIWGAGEDQGEDYIFGFTTEGEEEARIEDPLRPTANIAWDPDREWLWICGNTTDIKAIDLEGNEHAEIDRRDQRIYGLAYYPNDEDGYPLYLFVKERDTNRSVVKKIDPDADEMMHVTYLDHEEGGSPYAAFITNQFDIYSWVMMTIANNSPNDGGDRIDIWQVEARKEWMQIDPEEGAIEAEESQEFELILDATDLPPEIFEGELVFLHDGVGGETHIPITLNVVEGPVHMIFPIDLSVGWNMISSYVQPEDDDPTHVVQNLVEDESLIMVKDGMGRFYRPDFNFNNIPFWDVSQGYLIKMADEGTLEIDGMTVVADEPIDLLEGWQMISYYLRFEVDARVALSGLGDALIMAKDGFGRFYNREWDFSNMGDMMAGRGYLVKTSREAELVYRMWEDEDEAFSAVPRLSHFPEPVNTSENMSVLVECAGLTGEIGVFSGDLIVGAGVIQDGRCGVAVWGDDPTTTTIDGLTANESYCLKLWNPSAGTEQELDIVAILTGKGAVYGKDDFTVLSVAAPGEIPSEYFLAQNYPNPFNASTSIRFGLPEANQAHLAIYNLNGRLVETLVNRELKAGFHSAVFNSANFTSGTYFYKLKAGEFESVQKMTVLK